MIQGIKMKMPMLVCSRCGLNDTIMVDAPLLSDPRQYCIDCYRILFPPGWTDEYDPIGEWPDMPTDFKAGKTPPRDDGGRDA